LFEKRNCPENVYISTLYVCTVFKLTSKSFLNQNFKMERVLDVLLKKEIGNFNVTRKKNQKKKNNLKKEKTFCQGQFGNLKMLLKKRKKNNERKI